MPVFWILVFFRYAAYRMLYFHIHGKSMKGKKRERVKLPNCLVCLVREKYPDKDGKYTNWKPASKKKK